MVDTIEAKIMRNLRDALNWDELTHVKKEHIYKAVRKGVCEGLLAYTIEQSQRDDTQQ